MKHVYLAAALLFVSTTALAQTSSISFGTQCTTGALRACVSLDIETRYHAVSVMPGWGPGTEVRIRISNPQGLPGYAYGPTAFRSLLVTGLQGGTAQGRQLTGPRHVGSTGNVITRGDLDLDDQHGVYAAYIEYNGPARLWGCEVSPDNWDVPTYGLDSTCGGSITVSILFLNDDLRLSNQSQLIMRGTQFGVDGSPVGGIACTTGVDCVAVTPEPVTIALVGTGLTGIGLLRRRRRREPS